ncbi:ribulose-phosphate 3-epimerase [Ligilactobacillus agilis]|uniref:ribulose-phosphate 3-epimerase n=1 Tax=Ligilactobacillus agilis TaxID=1601 RepID=UPI00254F46EA|nr:ribulose-phosphate 3-epimerase [Ligilactobacillus agilis]MDK6810416.1 ribulose-phosphate 3-epimerase [Ligilactobacillus agilis]
MKLAPSILSADFANLATEIEKVFNAEYIHIDIMDGHFVNNLTFGANVVQALRPYTKQVFDCHLMVTNPEDMLNALKEAGADIVGVHYEVCPHLHRTLAKIKELGMKSEVVINPATPVSVIEPVLTMVDQVLVMTVDPGLGGQGFLQEMLEKVSQLAEYKQENGLDFDIEVDGGINDQTIRLAKRAGATVAVAGSYIFKARNPAERLKILQESLNQGKMR